MVKVIEQETFDAVVQENIEEFDLSKEEAIKDAISQFEAQGVNLANIVTSSDGDGDQHIVIVALNCLALDEAMSEEKIVEHCSTVKSECSKGLAEKIMATKHDGYNILVKVALKDDLEKASLAAVQALAAFLQANPDPFDENCFNVIMLCLSDPDDAEMVAAGLDVALASCVRHEQNRQNLMRNKILDYLDKVYDKHAEAVAYIWQALVQDDDVRVPFGKAHDTAREIVEEHNAQGKLISSMKGNKNPSIYLACLSSLTVRNEYCQHVAENDGLVCLFDLLSDPDQKPQVLKEVLLLFKTLAGNDNLKREIRDSQKICVFVSIISQNVANKGICHAGASMLAAVCLRTPENAQQVIDAGGAEVLVQVLATHVKNAVVAVGCISAMRNIVSRSKNFTELFVKLDVEELLNQTGAMHPTEFAVCDAVKAALRDMGLKVHLKEEWTGKKGQVVSS